VLICSVVMLSVVFAECYYGECCRAECRYAVCHASGQRILLAESAISGGVTIRDVL
jgi:hypothetical protein